MTKCRLCNKELDILFVIKRACPNISYLPLAPCSMESKDLHVYECPFCSLVQLSEEDKDGVEYEDYFMATSGSQQMQECQKQQAELLKSLSLSTEAKILEVGCGDGSFVKHLMKVGFKVSAIEPSKRFFEHAQKVSSNIRNEYLTDNVYGSPYEIIVAREVLEHIYDFNTFLKQIYNALETNGLLMIQVPRLETAIKDLRLHTFFTDHVNYFSEKTLSLTLETNGFEVFYISSFMKEEYTVAIARKKSLNKILITEWENKTNTLKKYIEKKIEKNKIVFWGAGGKGLSILSAIEASQSENLMLVDCDEMKIGRYTPVTNFLIQDSSKLIDINPDIIIILADAYRDEILSKIKLLGFKGTVTYPGDVIL